MLSTFVFGALLHSVNADIIADPNDAPPTREPTEEPESEGGPLILQLEPAEIELAEPTPVFEGYVYGTEDHDSCPEDYIPITNADECKAAAMILGKGWLRAQGIGVCTFITNSKHANDNGKFFFGPIGAEEHSEANHHTLICQRADCGEIERNFEYVGGDLRQIEDVENAEECAALCADEVECESFTYVKVLGPRHRTCYLKNELRPGRELTSCCDSGVACHEDEPEECISLPPEWMDEDGDGCTAYGDGGWCGATWQGSVGGTAGFTADEACCECGGGISRRRRRTTKDSVLKRLFVAEDVAPARR